MHECVKVNAVDPLPEGYIWERKVVVGGAGRHVVRPRGCGRTIGTGIGTTGTSTVEEQRSA